MIFNLSRVKALSQFLVERVKPLILDVGIHVSGRTHSPLPALKQHDSQEPYSEIKDLYEGTSPIPIGQFIQKIFTQTNLYARCALASRERWPHAVISLKVPQLQRPARLSARIAGPATISLTSPHARRRPADPPLCSKVGVSEEKEGTGAGGGRPRGTGATRGHSMRLLLAATPEVMDLAEMDWIKETRPAIALAHARAPPHTPYSESFREHKLLEEGARECRRSDGWLNGNGKCMSQSCELAAQTRSSLG
ncbi:hypothetical protein EVAR_56655_1 [Eumeta japonica]|uniref:Uncharacterized protein n=1 Tax=Eumeta variegata TaxID=151549 RepID=A0A4C1YUZ0_EUMVA|nr:hypothetical protein EVAR_56655_1 [Eumeta japonica]